MPKFVLVNSQLQCCVVEAVRINSQVMAALEKLYDLDKGSWVKNRNTDKAPFAEDIAVFAETVNAEDTKPVLIDEASRGMCNIVGYTYNGMYFGPSRYKPLDDKLWPTHLKPSMPLAKPYLLMFQSHLQKLYPDACVTVRTGFMALNRQGDFELDGVQGMWDAFVLGLTADTQDIDAKRDILMERCAHILVDDFGPKPVHNMPCSVNGLMLATYDEDTDVFQPSQPAQADGWHLIQAESWLQRKLYEWFFKR